MSELERKEIAELISAAKKVDVRWNVYKILTALGCTVLAIFACGSWFGNWSNWRGEVDKDRIEFHAHIDNIQSEKNAERAEKNKNINVKKYQP